MRRQAVRALGGVPELAKADLDLLLGRFDADGHGKIDLNSFFSWADKEYLSRPGVENAVRSRRARNTPKSDGDERLLTVMRNFSQRVTTRSTGFDPLLLMKRSFLDSFDPRVASKLYACLGEAWLGLVGNRSATS